MLEKMYGLLEKHWDKFTEEPLAFLLALAAGIGIGWLLKKLVDEGQINALDARIETCNDRLKSSESLYDERMKGKDDILAEYRERLKIAPTDQTTYSRLTHAELRQKAQSFIDKLGDYWNSRKQEQDNSSMRYFEQGRATHSKEERKLLFHQHMNQDRTDSQEFHRHYNEVFRSDAILLRDEMHSRLPATARNKDLRTLSSYDFPVNDFCVQAIIVDIERLAKSLP